MPVDRAVPGGAQAGPLPARQTGQSGGGRRLVFTYGTREALWGGMGRELIREDEPFRSSLARCDKVVRDRLGWSLLEELERDGPGYRAHVSEELAPPVLTGLQIALTELWLSRGIRPAAVLGRCTGEFAAAFGAGALGAAAAMELACRTSMGVRRRQGLGRLLAVEVGAEDAGRLARGSPRPLHLACHGLLRETILACATEDLEAIRAYLEENGLQVQAVKSEFALHSPATAGWRERFLRPLPGGGPAAAAVPVFSAQAGGRVDLSRIGPEHWYRVVGDTVLTVGAARSVLEAGYDLFLEVGPGPSMERPILETAAGRGDLVSVLASMEYYKPAWPVLEATEQVLRGMGLAIGAPGA